MARTNDVPAGKVAFFAHTSFGLEVVTHALAVRPGAVGRVVTVEDDEIAALARDHGVDTFLYGDITADTAAELLGGLDFIFLAWWPKIIPKYVIDLPAGGVVNCHPSMLPFNRGKHYNFWTIVEGTPFGVTLHLVDEGIDTGDILFQSPIEKDWADTGETLYHRAREALLRLFKDRYLQILDHDFTPTPQDPDAGTMHYARELDPASEIDLDTATTARELLDLLRARTFEGHPSCYFIDDGRKYEVRVSIKRADDG